MPMTTLKPTPMPMAKEAGYSPPQYPSIEHSPPEYPMQYPLAEAQPSENLLATAQFIQLCVDAKVLRFGEFQLKSGRTSPYFFNAGLFNRGNFMSRLAGHYAAAIAEKITPPFMLFGPAYKGISLAATTAMKLADAYNIDVEYAYNRKETKDHGEGGELVGAKLRGKVVIIDDVITVGTAIGESVEMISAAGAMPHAVVVALDRGEVVGHDDGGGGNNNKNHKNHGARISAVQAVQQKYGIAVHAIAGLRDVIDYLARMVNNVDGADGEMDRHLSVIREYHAQYGVDGGR